MKYVKPHAPMLDANKQQHRVLAFRNAYQFSPSLSRSLCAHRLTGIIDNGRRQTRRQQRAMDRNGDGVSKTGVTTTDN